MKTIRCSLLLLAPLLLHAQTRLPAYPDSLFPTYYHQRVTHFQTLHRSCTDILFLGNSITDGAEWSELFNDARIRNRGISGDITAGVLHRLAYLAGGTPEKVFLLIGINDLSRGTSPDSVVKNILLIADYLHEQTPATHLYVQSLLPVNDGFGKFGTHTNKGRDILVVNRSLQNDAESHHYSFVDLYSSFCDSAGKLRSAFTNDGLHLTGEGYLLWKHLLYADVFDLAEKPSLIPLPWQLQWRPGYFWLSHCAGIAVNDSALIREARFLQEELSRKGIRLPIVKDMNAAGPIDPRISDESGYIRLRLGEVTVDGGRDEAYRLAVSSDGVEIEGKSPHGIFNGAQTLLQLARDGAIIDGCAVTDRPAFSWRGYMVDVARNFHSMDLLKQQIDIMGRYKLNVFHFHLTEDIAWRIAIQKYPPLTAPNTMLRDAGSFYCEEDIRELIGYCNERHIVFLPGD
ncbi:MAG TPA: family 20 glycosylhydrolase [Puia sp.]|nr:family 20 glycosylhydrolase [Puia sp.]